MSCTPETPSIANRVSPIGGSINRNLLTPCRRVGLSRKRKTPSSIVKMCTGSSPVSNNDSSVIQTTPVNYKKCMKRKSNVKFPITSLEDTSLLVENAELEREKNIDSKPFESCRDNNVKKTLSKELLQSYSDDLFDGSDASFINAEEPESSTNTETISNMEIATSRGFVDQSLVVDTESNDTEIHATSQDNLIKCGNRLSNTHSLVIKDSNSNNTSNKMNLSEYSIDQTNDSDEDFRLVDKSNKKHKKGYSKVITQKRIKKTLSLKKSISLSDDEFDINTNQASNSFKGCSVQLQRISEDQMHVPAKNQNLTDDASCDRSMDSIIIDEEEDAFTSTPEQEKIKKNDMLQKVKMMEKVVKHKREQLGDLRQASIYKNKHSIEDIRQLTSKWIAGCVSGLNDLLIQLQAHGPMSMATLLNNLHIPSDIVAKLSLNID